jgi:glucose-6-phosphate dehydrogenase assembly protein OpcA
MIGAQALKTGLWPEYLEMNRELTQHLGALADQIIADCINSDRSDAEVIVGLPATAAADAEMRG